MPLSLCWFHSGVAYRVTSWPEVRFERQYGEDWIALPTLGGALASAARALGPLEWRNYLEFVPTPVRHFLEKFPHGKLEALEVAARCPGLLGVLDEAPALTSFLSAHQALRGDPEPRWKEINARWERDGIFGLLEWLGLPASRQTLEILGQIVEPDLAHRFLEPLRTLLWEPRAIYALQDQGRITDRDLQQHCHALAA